MHEEHQAGFPKFAGNGQAFPGPPLLWKRFFQVDLTATSAETRNAKLIKSLSNPVACPIRAQRFWLNEGIVLVVRVSDMFWRIRDANSSYLGQLRVQNCGVLFAGFA